MNQSIDAVVLARTVSRLLGEAMLLETSITTAQKHCDESIARMERSLVPLRREIARLEDALYWQRLNDLIHTPSWRYRVAG